MAANDTEVLAKLAAVFHLEMHLNCGLLLHRLLQRLLGKTTVVGQWPEHRSAVRALAARLR